MTTFEEIDNWKGFIDSLQDLPRLDYVWRYSTIPIVVPENVSTHSYWVAVYSALIHQAVHPDDNETLLACVLNALLHDATEGKVGDFVRTFKYRTKNLKKAIDEAELQIIDEFPSSFKALHSKTDDLCRQRNEYITAIVKAADFLSLFHFMKREAARGNLEIIPFYNRMVHDIAEMSNGVEEINGFKLKAFYHTLWKISVDIREVCFEGLHQCTDWNREI